MANREVTPVTRRATPAPTDPFTALQSEIDRLFENFTGGFGLTPFGGGEQRLVPDVDVAETDEAIEVTAELPGVDEKDLEVTLTDGVLTIRGEKKAEKEEKNKNYHRIERSYGVFERRLVLPEGIDEDQVKATFSKGVLKVVVPKKAEAKKATRKVEVKAAD